MKIKTKFRQRVKFTSAVIIMAFGVGNKGYTQNTHQAVMDVRVQVVSGSQYIDKSITNISDQVQNGSERFTFGRFDLSIPKNTEFTISHSPVINMKDDFNSWQIQTDMQQEETKDGKIILQLNGHNSTTIPDGSFAGEHVVRIEYF